MSTQFKTPAGFLLHAREFLVAAELVLNQATGVSLPAYFLFGRSIELSLKAFLLSRGMTPRQLKSYPFGHNLDLLFKEAIKQGLKHKVPFDPIEAGVIKLLSCDYMGKRFEYRVTGGIYHLPLIEVTEKISRKLIEGLEPYCFGDHHNDKKDNCV